MCQAVFWASGIEFLETTGSLGEIGNKQANKYMVCEMVLLPGIWKIKSVSNGGRCGDVYESCFSRGVGRKT